MAESLSSFAECSLRFVYLYPSMCRSPHGLFGATAIFAFLAKLLTIRRLAAATLCLSLLLIGINALMLYHSRQEALRNAEQIGGNLAMSLAQDIQRNIQIYDLSLQSAAAALDFPNLAELSPAARDQVLFDGSTRAVDFNTIGIIDAQGKIIYESGQSRPRDDVLASKSWFIYHRDHPETGLHLTVLGKNTLTSRQALALSRRLENSDGSFRGVVIGSIFIDYFRKLFESLNLGSENIFILLTTDGEVVARRPFNAADVGRSVAQTDVFRHLKMAPSGSFVSHSGIDGVERIYSYRRVGNLPLVVQVGLNTKAAYSDWVRTTAVFGAVLLTVVATTSLLFFALRREFAARERAEREARNSEANYRQANEKLDHLARHLSVARDRADAANRAKSRFLATMSHELRTPLNGILGYAQLMQCDGDLTARQAERVSAMTSAGSHLLQMISGVLDLSAIETGHLELHPEAFDPVHLISGCVGLVRPAAEAKGLTLQFLRPDPVGGSVVADATRLRQVLLNLLGNATKFTRTGRIAVTLQSSRNNLRINVLDTGPGIDPEQRDKLFQDFARLEGETREVEGSGLGLALSARLAQLMGGHLSHAVNPEGGSIFSIAIPVELESTAPDAIAPSQQTPARDLTGVRVLVVDDVEMNRDIAKGLLQALGCLVTTADGGASAIDAATNEDFDVILMDVRMPGIDGLAATRQIRALQTRRALIPIIALTAQTFSEQIAELRYAGMTHYLAKPFTVSGLAETISKVITVAACPAEPNQTQSPQHQEESCEVPTFNRAAFDRTAKLLPPQAVNSYVETLRESTVSLLDLLRRCPQDRDIADRAHSLAGSAGMLGFERLTDAARKFEYATQKQSANSSEMVEQLIATSELSLLSMDALRSYPDEERLMTPEVA